MASSPSSGSSDLTSPSGGYVSTDPGVQAIIKSMQGQASSGMTGAGGVYLTPSGDIEKQGTTASKGEMVPSPVILSSDQVRAQNANNLERANQMIAQWGGPTPPGVTPPPVDNSKPASNMEHWNTLGGNAGDTAKGNGNGNAVLFKADADRIFGTDMTGVTYDPAKQTYTPDDSALQRVGLTRDQLQNTTGTNDTTNTTGGLNVNSQLQAAQNESNAFHASIQQQIADVRSGKFMTPDEQSMLDSISQMTARNARAQDQANLASQGAAKVAGLRSGLANSAMAQNMVLGNIISQGRQKIMDLEAQGMKSYIEAKQAMQTKDVQALNDSLNAFDRNQAEKTKTIQDMYNNVRQIDLDKQKSAQDQFDNRLKLLNEIRQENKDTVDAQNKIRDDARATLKWGFDLTGDGSVFKNMIPSQKAQMEKDANLAPGTLDAAIEHGRTLKGEQQDLQAAKMVKAYPANKYHGDISFDPVKNKYFENGKEVSKSYASQGSDPTTHTGSSSDAVAIKGIFQKLPKTKILGSDGFMSPQDYTTLRNAWIHDGHSPAFFDTKMKGYRNPQNTNYSTNK